MIIWDPIKAESNIKKYGIFFSDVEPVFFDPFALTIEDERSEGEGRYVTIGMGALGRILATVYTYRGNDVRLISARRATRNERQEYEKGIRS